ncbi:MAG: hypothetical protein ABFD91_16910, partial [Anaerohalosphaeraceae bacterium]
YLWHGRHAYKLIPLCEQFDVKIVAYLRRQDDLLMSRYNQHIKVTGEPFQNVLYFFPKVEHAMNYELVLGRWEKQFGRDAIRVRPYEKQQFHGQNIFGDFLHHILGLELTAEYRLPKKDINPRLSRSAMAYIQLMHGLNLIGDMRDRLIGVLLKYSITAGQESEDKSDKHGLLSPRERLTVIDKYARINEKVARTYLGREDGRLFYDALPDPQQEYVPYAGLSGETAGEITTFIRRIDPDLYQSINRALACTIQSVSDEKKQSLNLLSDFESVRAACRTGTAETATQRSANPSDISQAKTGKHPVAHTIRRWKGSMYYAWMLLVQYCKARHRWTRNKKEKL